MKQIKHYSNNQGDEFYAVEDDSSFYICIRRKFISSSFSFAAHYVVRDVTEAEKAYFNRCKEEKRFIPIEEIELNYQIY